MSWLHYNTDTDVMIFNFSIVFNIKQLPFFVAWQNPPISENFSVHSNLFPKTMSNISFCTLFDLHDLAFYFFMTFFFFFTPFSGFTGKQ